MRKGRARTNSILFFNWDLASTGRRRVGGGLPGVVPHTPTVTAEWQTRIGICARCPSRDSIPVQDEWIWVHLKSQKRSGCHDTCTRHCKWGVCVGVQQSLLSRLAPQSHPNSAPSPNSSGNPQMSPTPCYDVCETILLFFWMARLLPFVEV